MRRSAQLTGARIESGKDLSHREDQLVAWRNSREVVLQLIQGGNFIVADMTPRQALELAESLIELARGLLGMKLYLGKEKP